MIVVLLEDVRLRLGHKKENLNEIIIEAVDKIKSMFNKNISAFITILTDDMNNIKYQCRGLNVSDYEGIYDGSNGKIIIDTSMINDEFRDEDILEFLQIYYHELIHATFKNDLNEAYKEDTYTKEVIDEFIAYYYSLKIISEVRESKGINGELSLREERNYHTTITNEWYTKEERTYKDVRKLLNSYGAKNAVEILLDELYKYKIPDKNTGFTIVKEKLRKSLDTKLDDEDLKYIKEMINNCFSINKYYETHED